MELKPVYLLAPAPEPPKVSRRAFLGGVSVALLGGVAGGYGAGRWLGGRSTATAPEGAPLDPAVSWARGVATGEMAALVVARVPFLDVVYHHRDDVTLWAGVDRLVEFAFQSQDDGPAIAGDLLTVLEGSDRYDGRILEGLHRLAR